VNRTTISFVVGWCRDVVENLLLTSSPATNLEDAHHIGISEIQPEITPEGQERR
jgi:hypothetical protein